MKNMLMKHVIITRNFHGVVPGDIVYLDGDDAYNNNRMRALMNDAFKRLAPREDAHYLVRESVSDTIQVAWATNIERVTPGLPCLVVDKIEQCPQFVRVGLTIENGNKKMHVIGHHSDKVFYSSAITSKILAFTLAIWEKTTFGVYETIADTLHFCILAIPATVQLMCSQWPAGKVQNEK